MKKLSVTTASITLSIGLVVALGGGVAMAHGHGHGPGSHGPSSASATGSATCNVHGIVVFAANGDVTFRGNITPSHGASCTSSSGTKLHTGHFSSPLTSATTTTTTSTSTTTSSSTTSTSTTTTTTVVGATTTTTIACTPVPSGALPNLGNGTITWNPRPKFAPSSGITLTGGSASVSTNQHLQITYTAGAVASGSFAGGTASLSLTSRQTLAQLQSRCESGNFVIAVVGTITL